MTVEVVPVSGLPEVQPGDDLPSLIVMALHGRSIALEDGDVVAVTQKVVSKAEGRLVPEQPEGKQAWVRREARRVVATRGEVLIVETRHGFVCANAGVDASNVAEGFLSLLPEDPDGAAEGLRSRIREATRADVAVIITDTFGRPWRSGVVNVAIGCAGLPSLVDLRGTKDALGRVLDATIVALADEVAAASGLVMGKADGTPVAVVRGVRADAPVSPAAALVRPAREDLFRTAPLQAIRDRLEATSFDHRAVDRAVVEEAVAVALTEAPGRGTVAFVMADSSPARRLLVRAIHSEDRATLGEAPVVVVPVLSLGKEHEGNARLEAIAAGGAAVQRLLLALSAQGVASSWLGSSRFDAVLLSEAVGGSEGASLGAVVAGWPVRYP